MCRICEMKDPLRFEVERQLQAGEISISKAAEVLGVSYAEMWEHAKHMTAPEPIPEELDAKLKYLIDLLESRIRQLATTPVGSVTDKNIAALVREMRATIESLARLRGMIQTQPQVTVNIQLFGQLKDLLLREAPPELKAKVIRLLEEYAEEEVEP